MKNLWKLLANNLWALIICSIFSVGNWYLWYIPNNSNSTNNICLMEKATPISERLKVATMLQNLLWRFDHGLSVEEDISLLSEHLSPDIWQKLSVKYQDTHLDHAEWIEKLNHEDEWLLWSITARGDITGKPLLKMALQNRNDQQIALALQNMREFPELQQIITKRLAFRNLLQEMLTDMLLWRPQ